MYHATPSRDKRVDYFDVHVDALALQLAYLQERRLLGQSLESCLSTASSKPCVAITFDDAHVSNFEFAFPVLAAHGMTATIFAVPEWVGTTGYCSWGQLRQLHNAGWSIQSHTLTHPFLSTLSHEQVQRELVQSRVVIEEEVGAAVETVALPNGDWPIKSIRHLIPEAGYRYIATSRWHANGAAEATRGILGRYTVRRDTSLSSFAKTVDMLPGTWSNEGLRLSVLSSLRGALGVDRYRSIRRLLLKGLE
jgi:peptidoglycan/xylan/chitin deacetylase (PgdA/CDA1 family)